MTANIVPPAEEIFGSAQVFKTLTEMSLARTVWKTFPGSTVKGQPTMNGIDLLGDVPVELSVEVGRSNVALQEVMSFSPGMVLELDGLAGEPLNIFVNGRLIARGETVVVNDKFGIRLTDMVTLTEKLKVYGR